MGTEDRQKFGSRYIDELSSFQRTTGLLVEQKNAWMAVYQAKLAIDQAAQKIAERLKSGSGRLLYAGAGTSGRLAVGDGAELWPTFNWPHERVGYFIAGGFGALWRSVEGAEDDRVAAQVDVAKKDVGSDDVLIALSASGKTPYTLECLRECKAQRALTIGIANNQGTPMLTEAQCPVFLDTGAEVIAGSTRMKAGTAQRIVLNTLSSLVMIQMGYVYKGLMINVQPVCDKLRKRCVRIVTELASCSEEDARVALEKRAWDPMRAAVEICGAEAFLRFTENNADAH